MLTPLKLTGSRGFIDVRSLVLDRIREAGEEEGFADAIPTSWDRKTPILIRRSRKHGHGKVLDGWRRVRGSLQSNFAAIEAEDLGDIDDTTALAHVGRTGLLGPKYRDPWVLCTTIEELEERHPEFVRPEEMGAYLAVKTRLIEAARAIRNVESGSAVEEAFDGKFIDLQELRAIARIEEPYGQDKVLDRYMAGRKSVARLRRMVRERLEWRLPPEEPSGWRGGFANAKWEASCALDRPLQDAFDEMSREDRQKATKALRAITALFDGKRGGQSSSGAKS